MPVSWQRRLSVSSATRMLRTIVPRIRCAVGSDSADVRRANPSFTSGGNILSARMYSSRATSSTRAGSILSEATFPDHLRPAGAFLTDGGGELRRRVGHGRHALLGERGPKV